MRDDHIKASWQQSDQNQPRMTVAQVRQSTEAFQKRARGGDLIEYIACAVVVIMCGFYVWTFPSLRMKFASLGMMSATLFVAYQLRRHGARGTWSPEITGGPLLEFHRRELTRRRNLLRDSWRLFVAPLLAAMLVFLVCLEPDRPYARLPLVILIGAVAFIGIAISFYNRWQARRLQRQIDELDSLDSPLEGTSHAGRSPS